VIQGTRGEHLAKIVVYPFGAGASTAQLAIRDSIFTDIRPLQDGAAIFWSGRAWMPLSNVEVIQNTPDSFGTDGLLKSYFAGFNSSSDTFTTASSDASAPFSGNNESWLTVGDNLTSVLNPFVTTPLTTSNFNSACHGYVTLVGGTVTTPAPSGCQLSTARALLVSQYAQAGTPGFLHAVITNGNSVTITSSSNTDTSQAMWQN
jgi:hypothetical protein